MTENDKTNESLEQPLMSTGTSEAGFDRDTKGSKPVNKPKIGETIVGDDGITGRIR